ncbi:MAG: hypothetical protein PHD88_04575 [Firmicutes bacterium]|nr:hypothetical protein [Bacillota bacterium]
MDKIPKYYDSEIVEKVRLNAVKMETYRDNRSFSEIELVLGFSAYVYWLAGVLKLEDKAQEEYLEGASETARQVALDFTAMLNDSQELLSAIKKITPFEPEEELKWSKTKTEPNNWKFSLTRAIILITRQLAYATLDFTNSIGKDAPQENLDFLEFVELSDLFQEAILWASFVIGIDSAQKLFNL